MTGEQELTWFVNLPRYLGDESCHRAAAAPIVRRELKRYSSCAGELHICTIGSSARGLEHIARWTDIKIIVPLSCAEQREMDGIDQVGAFRCSSWWRDVPIKVLAGLIVEV